MLGAALDPLGAGQFGKYSRCYPLISGGDIRSDGAARGAEGREPVITMASSFENRARIAFEHVVAFMGD